jgi:hypothetical protein
LEVALRLGELTTEFIGADKYEQTLNGWIENTSRGKIWNITKVLMMNLWKYFDTIARWDFLLSCVKL